MSILLRRFLAACFVCSVLNISPVAAADIAAYADGSRNAQTLDAVCRLTSEQFYDASLRGVNWAEECDKARARLGLGLRREAFAGIANDLLGTLKTSHTHYYPPEDTDHAILMDVFRFNRQLRDIRREVYGGEAHIDGIGALGAVEQGRFVVTDVLPSMPADGIGLQPGDELISVDGNPFHPVRSFLGKAGSTVQLVYRKVGQEEMSTAEVKVLRKPPHDLFADAARASALMERRNGRDIGYIRFWSLIGAEPQDILRNAIESGPLDGADALVIDIRVKIGGGGPELLDVIDRHAADMVYITRTGRQQSRDGYRGRFVMITDSGTRSAAEILADIVKTDGLGCLIGETTAGAVTAGRLFPLPDNGVLYLGVSGLEIGGRVLEGVGVSPHVEVKPGLTAPRGADAQREAAMALAARLPLKDCGVSQPTN